MNIIDGLIMTVQIAIRSGVVLRVCLCFIQMIMNEEEQSMYKRRIKNAVVFAVAAELVFLMKNLVIIYFG